MENPCIFGARLRELSKSPNFEARNDVIRTFKLSRIKGEKKRLLFIAVDEYTHKATQRAYQLNRTFLDRDDGGNTLGWIEDVTDGNDNSTEDAGKVVAEIIDTVFESCTVFED